MRYGILFLLMSGWMALSAQTERETGPYRLLFRLSAAEALHYYEQPSDSLDLPNWSTPLDTLWDRQALPHLPNGHYATVSGMLDDLVIQVFTVMDWEVQTEHVREELHLRLRVPDTTRLTAAAQVYLRKPKTKRVPFSTREQAFILHKPKVPSAYTILLGTDTVYYAIQGYVNNEPPFWLQRLKRVGQARPLRWVKRVIRNPRYGWRKTRSGPKPVLGYTTWSQPRYRHGDTLRFAASLANHRGRPYRRAWRLMVWDTKSKQVVDTLLKPSAPGQYALAMHLADSLQLGRYKAQLDYQGKGKLPPRMRIASFAVQDYELTAETYELRPTQSVFRYQDSVQIELTAKDANGFTLRDGRVELVVLTQKVTFATPTDRCVPDTLWRHRQVLSPVGITTVMLPDSLFPAGTLTAQVQAFFRNNSNNLVIKTAVLNVTRQPDFVFQYQQDSIVGSHPERTGETVLLKQLSYQKKVPFRVDTLTLPFRRALHPLASTYQLATADSVQRAVSVPDYFPRIRLQHSIRGDTLFWEMQNPAALAIRLRLHEQASNKLLELDTLRTTSGYWKRQVSGVFSYLLTYEYYWAGRWFKHTQVMGRAKHVLAVDLTHPDEILPGQAVEAEVTVRKTNGRPARKTPVLLSSLNDQFEGAAPRTGPQTARKRYIAKLNYDSYNFRQQTQRRQQLTSDLAWTQRLGMDTFRYQQLRLGTERLTVFTDTVLDLHPDLADWAQFAPFIFENGRQVPIHLMYHNRKLLYYQGVTAISPYAFSARPSTSSLILRTREYEYTINMEALRAGHKTEVALHTDDWQDTRQVSRRKVPSYWTPQEIRLLRNSIFHLQKVKQSSGVFVWQNEQYRVFDFSANRQASAGPFNERLSLFCLAQNRFVNRFDFEPGYKYEIAAQRERLYKYQLFPDREQPYELPRKAKPVLPGEFMVASASLPLQTRESVQYIVQRNFPRSVPKSAALTVTLPEKIVLQALLLEKDTLRATAHGSRRHWPSLPAGQLRLIGLTARDSFFIIPLELAAYRHCQLDLRERLVWQQDSVRAAAYRSSLAVANGRPPKLYRRLGDIQGYTSLAGKVLETGSGEPVLFGSVALYQNGVLVRGTETDFDGNFSFTNLAPGWYDVECSYLGFATSRLEGVLVQKHSETNIELSLEPAGTLLGEIVVVAYSIPLVEQDNTTQGGTITSEDIRSLPVRNINALVATMAGLSDGERDNANVRGSRNGATEYFVDGIRIQGQLIPENSGAQLPNEPELVNLRDDFRDLAYWYPQLRTDRQGKVRIPVQYPDDITAWYTYAIAHKGKRAGQTAQLVKAYKQLQARLYLPRFLVAGDEVDVVGSSINLSTQTWPIRTRFWLDSLAQTPKTHQLTEQIRETLRLTTPTDQDSLTVGYALRAGFFADGERRSIPVRPRGTLATEGAFWALEGDTTVQLHFDPKGSPITIRRHTSMWPQMIRDLRSVINYPYGCNEQNASRLLALLTLERVTTDSVRRDSISRRILGFVQRLQKAQSPEGYWGWFAGNHRNRHMTRYVLRALHTAAEAGYTSLALERGLRLLANEFSTLAWREQVATLHLFAELGQPFDFEKHTLRWDSLVGFPPYEQLQLLRIRQLAGLPYHLDSLYAWERRTLEGASYFGRENWRLFGGRVATQALAHQLLVDAGDLATAQRIRQYAVLERGRDRWRNTYETAAWVRLLAPYYPVQAEGDIRAAYRAGAQAFQTLPDGTTQIPATASVTIRHNGTHPVYLSAYQNRWDSEPEPIQGDLTIETRLIQAGQPVDSLQNGQAATLRATLNVKKTLNYGLVEIPIPAGCAYAYTDGRGRYENHREYFRDKLVIFYERLPPGTYTVDIPLEVRFSGQFILNPAKVEHLYFPVFHGREGMKRVVVQPAMK
ncbi:MAG: carboxypeptidase regulatory-like domain-containing protein [Bacteroidota bacterium]